MPWLLTQNDKDNYFYTHHNRDSTSKGIDVHEIFITKSRVRLLLSYIGILICLVNGYILLNKEKLCSGSIWKIIVVLLFAKFVQYKPVKKESIVILPEFGVQLETHYWSGRIARRFVPSGKILRPVLNECVTPFTCYWTLALILRGEDQLMLVFQVQKVFLSVFKQSCFWLQISEVILQELKPPLKLLVPIWKALCSSFDVEEGSCSS